MGLTGLASRFSRVSDKLQDMIDKLNNLETADASKLNSSYSLLAVSTPPFSTSEPLQIGS